jgi:enoyl-[acyl-carrier protein] reductase I
LNRERPCNPFPTPPLKGARALVVGVANTSSIAYGCAKAFRELGADLALTYLNEKARPHVEPLARELEAPLFLPLDVSADGAARSRVRRITRQWGKLDILVHSIAFAPKEDLQGGLINCSASGFAKAMDVSCHSFVRMARARRAAHEGRRHDDGDELSRREQGRADVQRHGPGEGRARVVLPLPGVRAGRQGIRVHAISPGPLKTRAASGLKDFDLLLTEAAQRAPIGELVDVMDVGFACAYLATPYARRVSGTTLHIDGGVNIMA